MILHGIELDNSDRPAWFRFGSLKMLHCLSQIGDRPEDAPEWIKRWRTVSFRTAVNKFEDTMRKFNRAAMYADRCQGSIKNFVERNPGSWQGISANDPEFTAFNSAVEDLPLYLDLLLFYFRIQADALAVVTPFLYEQKISPSRRSFRDQMKWFIKHSSIDPVYAKILDDHKQWFEKLAGKAPSGLRDVIVHSGGTYQLGWTVPTEAAQFQLQPAMVNAGGFVDDDVLVALERMTHGWCRFLDSWCDHFTNKLSPIVPWADLERNDLARYSSCNVNDLPSYWLYPRGFLPATASKLEAFDTIDRLIKRDESSVVSSGLGLARWIWFFVVAVIVVLIIMATS